MRANLLDILIGIGEGVILALIQRDAISADLSLPQIHALAGVDVLDGVELGAGLFVLEGQQHDVLLDVGGVSDWAEFGGWDVEF